MRRSAPALADLRPLPRFTFAGRGCRDPRREPRRRPDVATTRPGLLTAPPALPVASPVDPPRPSAARREPPCSLSSTGRGAATDRPPPHPRIVGRSLLFESDDKRQRMENFLNRRKR
jgi:hypothetical protein